MHFVDDKNKALVNVKTEKNTKTENCQKGTKVYDCSSQAKKGEREFQEKVVVKKQNHVMVKFNIIIKLY